MSESGSEDEIALLARIAGQDQTALADLYDRYGRILLGIAYRMLGSREEAEEVVADVFWQVWRAAGSYDPSRSRVDSWLFLITRSRSLDRLRALKRKARHLSASAAVIQDPLDPQVKMLQQEQGDQIQQVLQQMPPDQSQVIQLAYFSGLTQAEIAAQLQIPVGTVKTRIRLALAKLRHVFNPSNQ